MKGETRKLESRIESDNERADAALGGLDANAELYEEDLDR